MKHEANTIVELLVRNHAGVMSHITGMFSRRGFNLEGILCGPIGDSSESIMFLLVNHDNRLDQIVKQLEKLYDVQTVTIREDYDHSMFHRLNDWVGDFHKE